MVDFKLLDRITHRAIYLAVRMIFEANQRPKPKGEPKVGGHPAASTSVAHIMGALHLHWRQPQDILCNKPHASAMDHAYHYLLDLLLDANYQPLNPELAQNCLTRFRAFTAKGKDGFQSYHSHLDPDHWGFVPSGSVGIPPVIVGYLALAYQWGLNQGLMLPPNARFWAVIGDSEFREGSIWESFVEFAHYQLGNLIWILDYNRQSLDGHRIINFDAFQGNDCDRIEQTFKVNGWRVIHLRHGVLREKLIQSSQGALWLEFLEKELHDYQWQALLLIQNPEELYDTVSSEFPKYHRLWKNLKPSELKNIIWDFGGHSYPAIFKALEKAIVNENKPTLIIAHTVKGWGLKMAAKGGNHNLMIEEDEIRELQKQEGLPDENRWARFEAESPEGRFCLARGQTFWQGIQEILALKKQNENHWHNQIWQHGPLPESLDINLKLVSFPHTQWMLGQCWAKLDRCARTPLDVSNQPELRPLDESEKRWKNAASLIVTLSPDVASSTNLNPVMDGRVYGPTMTSGSLSLKLAQDRSAANPNPHNQKGANFLRMEITEANAICALGAFGKIFDFWGIPVLPVMSVYDFFIKRALDQYFYISYWKSRFILLGTPSGVTLAPEGAQHCWKSDFQIPNQCVWEPAFVTEVDWILTHILHDHFTQPDRVTCFGHLIRAVTRGIDHKQQIIWLRRQRRFKLISPQEVLTPEKMDKLPSLSDSEILKVVRQEVLEGAYPLILWEGYQDYTPGDNVVHIFVMGALVPEAVAACEQLLKKGIYANVFVVTNPDKLAGHVGFGNKWHYLRKELPGIASSYVTRVHPIETSLLGALRVPVVSVHDGEPGLLDSIGGILGVTQVSLAVRQHSRSGSVADVYAFHGLSTESIVQAAFEALENAASTVTVVSDSNGVTRSKGYSSSL